MKPELLLPVGSPEAFHAALAGGADAVYLGLARFNARQRAKNINTPQLAGILAIAAEKRVRVYVTLNTLIKNKELPELLDQLHLLEKSGVGAVIIQDWGVYHLIKNFFPNLEMHASTQMGIHNSAGAVALKELGFTRVVLSRELTIQEIAAIKRESGIEVEVFVHGALCYSISGRCLFSSWLGGMSANRGLCRQPCRRLYADQSGQTYLFSLNDLQLLERLPELRAAGVDSLKIEGRMKNAEYVHSVARAYRMALDEPERRTEALGLLTNDLGRPKTGYFPGGDVSHALEGSSFTGRRLGKVAALVAEGFVLTPEVSIGSRARLRVEDRAGRDTEMLKVRRLLVDGVEVETAPAGGAVTVIVGASSARKGAVVYLSLKGEARFPGKIPPARFDFTLTLADRRKQEILTALRRALPKPPGKRELFVRVDRLAWIPKIFFQRMDVLILALTREEAGQLDLGRPFLQKNLQKLAVQLPLFIPEADLEGWGACVRKLIAAKLTRFFLPCPTLRHLFPQSGSLRLYTSEEGYRMNDAAVLGINGQGIEAGVLPLENDLENLEAGGDRSGIVPSFYFPPLFTSRMPLAANPELVRDRDAAYRIERRDGLTVVTPERPACLFQQRKRLEGLGYGRFLIDLSHLKPSQNAFNRILKNFEEGRPEKQALSFNFKNGLQ